MLSCALCNKEFNIIKTKHLLSHGITREEYIDKYGGLVSSETSKRLSAGNKRHISNSRGKKFSDDARLHMSLADKGKPKSEEFKQNLRDYYAKPENKEKHSQEMTEYYKTHAHKGKKVLFEYNQLRKEGKYPGGNTGKKHTEEWKQEQSARSKINWENDDYARKIMGTKGQSKEEIEFNAFLQEIIPNKFVYVGNKSFRIGRKFPDFIDESDKFIIEFFGDYFHKNENPQNKIDYYAKYGWKALVIWASEFKKDKNMVIQRINAFLGGN